MKNKILNLLLSFTLLFPLNIYAQALTAHDAIFFNGGSATVDSNPFTSVTGEFIHVCLQAGTGDAFQSVSSVTDDAGNNYTFVAARNTSTNIARTEVWYAKNVTGLVGNIIHSVWTSVEAFPVIITREFSGMNTSSPLDSSAVSTAEVAATSYSAQGLTTTNANDLILTCADARDNIFSFPSGYTGGEDGTGYGLSWKVVAATQSGITPTTTGTNLRVWEVVDSAFKASSSPPPATALHSITLLGEGR